MLLMSPLIYLVMYKVSCDKLDDDAINDLVKRNFELKKIVSSLQSNQEKLNERMSKLETNCVHSGKDIHVDFVENKILNSEKKSDILVTDLSTEYKSYEYNQRSTNKIRYKKGINVSNADFYAYMSASQNLPSYGNAGATLKYDTVKTNIGNNYNQYTGVFTVPVQGAYAFSWRMCTEYYSYSHTELVINNTPFDSIIADSDQIHDQHCATGLVVAEVQPGDVVYIRLLPNGSQNGSIKSDYRSRTIFCGWKLF